MEIEPTDNPYTAPDIMSRATWRSRLFSGACCGAKWSLVLAVPFAACVFCILYRINTEPVTDALTDKEIQIPQTLVSLLRCISGAILIPLTTVVFPTSVACGVYAACGRYSKTTEYGGEMVP